MNKDLNRTAAGRNEDENGTKVGPKQHYKRIELSYVNVQNAATGK